MTNPSGEHEFDYWMKQFVVRLSYPTTKLQITYPTTELQITRTLSVWEPED